MESEWRFNVAWAGMSGTDWLRCARYLDAVEGVWIGVVQLRDAAPGLVRYYRIYPDFSVDFLPELILEATGLPGHFPHGINVEPD